MMIPKMTNLLFFSSTVTEKAFYSKVFIYYDFNSVIYKGIDFNYLNRITSLKYSGY